MRFLLDTNVLSELRRGARADAGVRAWARANAREEHHVSVISLGEIRTGIEILRRKAPAQCPAFERWLERIGIDYGERVLPVCDEVAGRWGRLMAERTLSVLDGLIAATALVHGLTVVTRNARDFEGTGVRLVNPWGERRSAGAT